MVSTSSGSYKYRILLINRCIFFQFFCEIITSSIWYIIFNIILLKIDEFLSAFSSQWLFRVWNKSRLVILSKLQCTVGPYVDGKSHSETKHRWDTSRTYTNGTNAVMAIKWFTHKLILAFKGHTEMILYNIRWISYFIK